MKYDLNRLKEAMDERIPMIQPDEGLLDRAMAQGKRARYPARALTAAAACLLIVAVLGALIGKTPEGSGLKGMLQAASRGSDGQGAANTVRVEEPEDLSSYQHYSPDYAHSALPDEAEFGGVVIRKLNDADRLFAFLDKETGEEVIPGRFWQAYAYFPKTETGLVQLGNGQGLMLVDKNREFFDGAYSSFEYAGGGTAIVANRDEDETEPDPMYLISTADGARLSRDYEIIGTMRSGENRLLMGHDTQELNGEFDIMDLTGRVIVRAQDLGGLYFDKWLSVRLPGESWYCLMDLNGEILMDGTRFGHVGMEKDGYLVVTTDKGRGVIDSEGNWVFEPGTYLTIEIRENGLFRVMDRKTAEMMQVDARGVNVDTWRFRVDQAMAAAGEALGRWQEGLGKPGYILVYVLIFWLALRLGLARRSGELPHMLLSELGFAAYVVGLLSIGHWMGLDYVTIWPTDTSTEGAMGAAFSWYLTAYALLASMIVCYPRLRRPKPAFFAGMAVMLLPWIWKSLCADMTVAEWQTMSVTVFMGGALLAVLLFFVKPVGRFMDWCARFDALNEYARWVRVIWWAIAAAALINFGAGCWISGQELISATTHADVQRGVMGSLGNAWIDDVNRMLDDYPEDDFTSQVRSASGMSEREYTAIAAARYLHKNGVDRLTDDMVLRVKVTGTVKTRRPARVQMVIEPETDGSCQISAESGLALPDGTIEGSADFILLPGRPAPEMKVWLSISQLADRNLDIAAQYWYRADIGEISVPDLAPEDSPY
ncbi:MAG: hypothetical protein IJE08_00070 [Clostridia bacterium]|nr:hypothetical protein [Clostridia bacterium]